MKIVMNWHNVHMNNLLCAANVASGVHIQKNDLPIAGALLHSYNNLHSGLEHLLDLLDLVGGDTEALG